MNERTPFSNRCLGPVPNPHTECLCGDIMLVPGTQLNIDWGGNIEDRASVGAYSIREEEEIHGVGGSRLVIEGDNKVPST